MIGRTNGVGNAPEGTEVKFRYTEMPVATSLDAGKIIQYVGETTSTYTKGYFYTAVESSGSWIWTQINVQPGSSGGGSTQWVGTRTGWNAEPDKTSFDTAVFTDTPTMLNSVDDTTGDLTEIANLNKIWRGTLAEWEALTPTEQNYYDQAEIDDDQYMTNVNQIVAHDKVVAVADWQADATYSGYDYKAEISMPGVTADYSPDVRFGFDDINSGIFAPVTDAIVNKVVIYAYQIPSTTITIPVIICTLIGV